MTGRAVLTAVLAAGVLAVGGGCAAGTSDAQPGGPVAPAAVVVGPPDSVASALEPALPVSVRIPRLSIDSRLVSLSVDAAGALEPPESAEIAGWHAAGTVPGEVGPAVIAGHVDSRSGPGVFSALRDLRPGDEVEVVRTDGVATFRVRAVEAVGKDEFPTDRVYGPTPVPVLRLITCGGEFDRATGHYRSNVIVVSELVAAPGEPKG